MVPAKTDTRWRDLVTGKVQHQFSFLGAKLLVTRISIRMMRDSSEEAIQLSIDELHAFFTKFPQMVEDDVRRLFS